MESIRALCDPRAFPHEVKEVEVIETHISWFAGELRRDVMEQSLI